MNTALRQPSNGYVAPLRPAAVRALPLSHQEEAACKVFPLGADMSREDDATGRFVVARRLSRKELAGLPCGQVVLYIYRDPLSEKDFPAGSYTLETAIGQLRRYDIKRGLLYVSRWVEGCEDEMGFADSEVVSAWVVQRFIACKA
jgi:hypothetical protein